MGCPASCILGENLTFTVQARDGTGAPADASSAVAYSVYEDETSTAILTGSMTKLASQTGYYSEQIACTAANGFERFKTYSIRITATVATISVAKSYGVICVGAEDTPTATTGALTSTANFKSYIGKTDSDDDTLIGYLISRATSAIENYCDRIFTSDEYRERYDGDGTTTLLLKQYPVTDVALMSTSIQDVMRITNTSSDAYNAFVTVVEDDADNSISETMTLTIAGGASAGTDSLTLSSYTVTTLAAAINALGSGWAATADQSSLGVWDGTELLPCAGLHCLDDYAYIQTPYEPEVDYTIDFELGELIYRGFFPRGSQNVVVRYTAGYVTTPADLEQICIDLTNVYWRGRNKDLGLKAESLADHKIVFAEDARDLPSHITKRLAPYKKFKI